MKITEIITEAYMEGFPTPEWPSGPFFIGRALEMIKGYGWQEVPLGTKKFKALLDAVISGMVVDDIYKTKQHPSYIKQGDQLVAAKKLPPKRSFGQAVQQGYIKIWQAPQKQSPTGNPNLSELQEPEIDTKQAQDVIAKIGQKAQAAAKLQPDQEIPEGRYYLYVDFSQHYVAKFITGTASRPGVEGQFTAAGFGGYYYFNHWNIGQGAALDRIRNSARRTDGF